MSKLYYLLFLQQFIASTTHIVAKGITGTVKPELILIIRSFIAAIFYIGWIMFRRQKLFRIEKKDILPFIILGALNVPINQFLFFSSIKLSTAPNVALAYALTPAFVLIISMIFLGEKATFLKTLGIVIAIVGTAIVLFEKGLELRSEHFTGNMLALAASIAWAIYTTYGKPYSIKYGAVYSTAVSMTIGFLLFIPVFILSGVGLDLQKLDFPNWLEVSYLGIFSSGVAYAVWYYVLKKMDAGKVSVFNNLQPVLTTILAIIFFNQSLSLMFIAGGVITLIGVFITQRG